MGLWLFVLDMSCVGKCPDLVAELFSYYGTAQVAFGTVHRSKIFNLSATNFPGKICKFLHSISQPSLASPTNAKFAKLDNRNNPAHSDRGRGLSIVLSLLSSRLHSAPSPSFLALPTQWAGPLFELYLGLTLFLSLSLRC